MYGWGWCVGGMRVIESQRHRGIRCANVSNFSRSVYAVVSFVLFDLVCVWCWFRLSLGYAGIVVFSRLGAHLALVLAATRLRCFCWS